MFPNQRFEISKTSKNKDVMSEAFVKNGDPLPTINLDIMELIRSIQRSEGHADCFRRDNGHCDQTGCAWRPYCLSFQSDAQQSLSK